MNFSIFIKCICEGLVNPFGVIDIYNNASACNSNNEVVNSCTMGLGDNNYFQKPSIFPNPAQSQLYIDISENQKINEITIYNNLGQQILYQSGSQASINISGLPSGLYIIEIVSKDWRARKKLIKH